MVPSILSDFHTPSLGPVWIIDHLRPPALRSNALPTDIVLSRYQVPSVLLLLDFVTQLL